MSLENVKPGDTLIWHGRYGRARRLVTVKRTTKTQIITDVGSKFRKSDGQHVGGTSWGSINVTVPKPGEIEEVRNGMLHHKLVSRILDACQINLLRKMSLEKLKQLNEVLETL